jgi:hypothetical protein
MPYRPVEEDERAELKMVADMRFDAFGSYAADKVEKKAKPCVWVLMGHAGIEMVEKPGEKRGWRQ